MVSVYKKIVTPEHVIHYCQQSSDNARIIFKAYKMPIKTKRHCETSASPRSSPAAGRWLKVARIAALR